MTEDHPEGEASRCTSGNRSEVLISLSAFEVKKRSQRSVKIGESPRFPAEQTSRTGQISQERSCRRVGGSVTRGTGASQSPVCELREVIHTRGSARCGGSRGRIKKSEVGNSDRRACAHLRGWTSRATARSFLRLRACVRRGAAESLRQDAVQMRFRSFFLRMKDRPIGHQARPRRRSCRTAEPLASGLESKDISINDQCRGVSYERQYFRV